jgi:hypothetical protein
VLSCCSGNKEAANALTLPDVAALLQNYFREQLNSYIRERENTRDVAYYSAVHVLPEEAATSKYHFMPLPWDGNIVAEWDNLRFAPLENDLKQTAGKKIILK